MSNPDVNEQVRNAMESPEARAKAEDPAAEQRVKEGLERSAEKLKATLKGAWEDVQDLYRMSFDKDFDVKGSVKAVSVVALLYLVSPVDVVPDWVPVLGVADDVAVAAYALNFAQSEIERYRAFRAARGA